MTRLTERGRIVFGNVTERGRTVVNNLTERGALVTPAAAASSVLVSDSFNRANSTTSLGTTDSASGGSAHTWAVISGGTAVWGISSNQAYTSTGANDSPAYVNMSTQADNVRISLDLVNPSSIFISGIAFRIQNNTNYFRAWATINTVHVERMVNGATTTIINQALSGLTAPFTLGIELSGSTINALINGVQKATVTDTTFQTATFHGMYVGNSTTILLDNFKIESLAVNNAYNLPTGSMTAATTFSSPNLERAYNLASGTMASSVSLTAPELDKVYDLASGTMAAAVSLTAPELDKGYNLASGTMTAAVSLTAPALDKQADLATNGLVISMQMQAPSLDKAAALSAGPLPAIVVFSSPTLTVTGANYSLSSGTMTASVAMQPAVLDRAFTLPNGSFTASMLVQPAMLDRVVDLTASALGIAALFATGALGSTFSLSAGPLPIAVSMPSGNLTVINYALLNVPTFTLIGKRIIDITLAGNRVLTITLAGNRVLTITLTGGVDVVADITDPVWTGKTYNININLPGVNLNGGLIEWHLLRGSTVMLTKSSISGGITISDPGPTNAQFIVHLLPADTDLFPGGTYLHEAHLVDAAGYDSTVASGTVPMLKSSF